MSYPLFSLSPSLSSSSPPPSPQGGGKYTALIKASAYGHTAAVKAIVAADPHPDHIRMTQVR